MKLQPIDKSDEYRDVFKAHEASAALMVIFFLAQGMLPAINRMEHSLHQSGIPFYLNHEFKQHFKAGAKALEQARFQFSQVNELFTSQLDIRHYDKTFEMGNDLIKFCMLFFDRCCSRDEKGNFELAENKTNYIHQLMRNGMSGQGIISDEFIDYFKLK